VFPGHEADEFREAGDRPPDKANASEVIPGNGIHIRVKHFPHRDLQPPGIQLSLVQIPDLLPAHASSPDPDRGERLPVFPDVIRVSALIRSSLTRSSSAPGQVHFSRQARTGTAIRRSLATGQDE